MLCIKCITRLHVTYGFYGLCINWVISHPPYSHYCKQHQLPAPICRISRGTNVEISALLPTQSAKLCALSLSKTGWYLLSPCAKYWCHNKLSFIFCENKNEFAADNKASLSFKSLSNTFIFLRNFLVSFSEIGISPGWFPLTGWKLLGYTSTQIDPRYIGL